MKFNWLVILVSVLILFLGIPLIPLVFIVPKTPFLWPDWIYICEYILYGAVIGFFLQRKPVASTLLIAVLILLLDGVLFPNIYLKLFSGMLDLNNEVIRNAFFNLMFLKARIFLLIPGGYFGKIVKAGYLRLKQQ